MLIRDIEKNIYLKLQKKAEEIYLIEEVREQNRREDIKKAQEKIKIEGIEDLYKMSSGRKNNNEVKLQVDLAQSKAKLLKK